MSNPEHVEWFRSQVKSWNQKTRNDHQRNKQDQQPRQQLKLNSLDLSGADLHGLTVRWVDLSCSNLRGTNFRKSKFQNVNLSGCDFENANLERSDLKYCDLKLANLTQALIQRADFTGSNLNGTVLVRLEAAHRVSFYAASLRDADLTHSDLKMANFGRADLSGANLAHASLVEASLRQAMLRNASFHGANLTGVRLPGADLTGACLTGACIENWHPNRKTHLSQVQCDYIFLESGDRDSSTLDFSDRRPHIGNFKPGEFAALFQQSLDTLDLIFLDGIDWQTFFASLQELRQRYSYSELNIQSIEKKRNGAFVVRLEVDASLDKPMLQQSWEQIYEENQQLKAQLSRKEGKLEAYKEQLEGFQQKVLQGMADKTPNITNHFNGATIGNFANQLNDNASQSTTQNIYSAEPQTPAEAAKEIQDLLVQLALDNPLATDGDRAEHVRNTLPPTRLQRIVELTQTAGEAAVESLPGGKVVTAVLKKVREQEEVLRKAQSED